MTSIADIMTRLACDAFERDICVRKIFAKTLKDLANDAEYLSPELEKELLAHGLVRSNDKWKIGAGMAAMLIIPEAIKTVKDMVKDESAKLEEMHACQCLLDHTVHINACRFVKARLIAMSANRHLSVMFMSELVVDVTTLYNDCEKIAYSLPKLLVSFIEDINTDIDEEHTNINTAHNALTKLYANLNTLEAFDAHAKYDATVSINSFKDGTSYIKYVDGAALTFDEFAKIIGWFATFTMRCKYDFGRDFGIDLMTHINVAIIDANDNCRVTIKQLTKFNYDRVIKHD